MSSIDGRLFGEAAAELAGYASSLLGWKPDEFWDSTPSELATAAGLNGEAGETMNRETLERLLDRFPDNRKD